MFEKLRKGSDELGCTTTVKRHPDGILEIGSLIFKDGKRYDKKEFEYVLDNWKEFFDEKPAFDEVFNELEEDYFDEYDDPCEHDAECLIKKIESNSDDIHCHESEFRFDGKKLQICKHYKQPYINAYEETRAYGGPEEGGWYYTEGRPVGSIPIFSKENEEYVREMIKGLEYRCFSNGKFKIRTSCCGKGQRYPQRRPHYS